MKVIINSQTQIQDEEGKQLSFSDLLKIVVNTPPEKGLNISAMRDRLKLFDILDKASVEISLEDSDFNLAKKLFDEYGWARPHKDIIALADHLADLAKTK